jgi:hypothetical protein
MFLNVSVSHNQPSFVIQMLFIQSNNSSAKISLYCLFRGIWSRLVGLTLKIHQREREKRNGPQHHSGVTITIPLPTPSTIYINPLLNQARNFPLLITKTE